MKKLAPILLCFALFVSWVDDDMDKAERANAKIKAIYMYNFTKYIEWPKSYKEGKFVMGVMGTNNYLFDELTKMAISKMVGTQKIEIKSLSSAEQAANCHIVFLLNSHSDKIKEVNNAIKNKSVLVITDKPGMAKQGAGINFVVIDNKQKIELNKINIEKNKLKVASTLIDMAITVN